jgi:hypothetical protein
MESGIELISAERQRQISKEGWTPEHDDTHKYGELAKAAACYAIHHTDAIVREDCGQTAGDAWPWPEEWDKRKKHSTLRALTIAGALIAAEIDRLQRAGRSQYVQRAKEPRA